MKVQTSFLRRFCIALWWTLFSLGVSRLSAEIVSFEINTDRSEYLRRENIYIKGVIINIGSREIKTLKPLLHWYVRDVSGDTLLPWVSTIYPIFTEDMLIPLQPGESLIVEKEISWLYPNNIKEGMYELFSVQWFPRLPVSGLSAEDLGILEKALRNPNIFQATKAKAKQFLISNKVIIKIISPSGGEVEAMKLLIAGRKGPNFFMKETGSLTPAFISDKEREERALLKDVNIYGNAALKDLLKRYPQSRYAKQAQMQLALNTKEFDSAKEEILKVLSSDYKATRADSMAVFEAIGERLLRVGKKKEAEDWLSKRPKLKGK